MTDRPRIEEIALDVLKCALSWEPRARLIGDVLAAEVAALAAQQITTCPKCGAGAWSGSECDLCDLEVSEGVSAIVQTNQKTSCMQTSKRVCSKSSPGKGHGAATCV